MNTKQEKVFYELLETLMILNPKVLFQFTYSATEPTLHYINEIIPHIKLPTGWYWNENDGLTNREIARLGEEISIKII